MRKLKWAALFAALVVAGYAIKATAQPVIAEMKAKFFESWVEFVYDLTPGTVGDTILATLDGDDARIILSSDVRVCDTFDGCPAPSVATANGELYVEGDLECDGNLNVAGTSTFTGGQTFTGDATLNGGAGAITLSGSGDSSVVLADNDTTALVVGATDALSIITVDTANSAEGVTVTGYLSSTGDVTCQGGVGAARFTDSASSIILPDNDTSALDIGTTGATNLLRFDTGDNTETVIVDGTTATTAFHVDIGEAVFDEGVDMAVPAMNVVQIRFCGNGPDGATTTYMGPVLLDDTEADLAFGGAGCDGLESTTEATADNPWHAGFAFKPVAMACVGLCTGGSAANDAIVFQLRDDAASVTGMTCTTAALGGDGVPAQCTVRDASPATVAAASALAISITMTDDDCNDAGDDFECLVTVTF